MTVTTWQILDTAMRIAIPVLTFWLGVAVKRPKLRVVGGGSGSIRIPGKDVMATHATIQNQPTFLHFFKVNREAATIVGVRIFDPALNEDVGPALAWQDRGDQPLQHECTIGSGRHATIYVFAKERNSDEYFIFTPNKLTDDLPERRWKYTDAKKRFWACSNGC